VGNRAADAWACGVLAAEIRRGRVVAGRNGSVRLKGGALPDDVGEALGLFA
jgi:hypothetical protein